MSGGSERRVAMHFPAESEVPETKRHLELRTLLYQILKLAFSEQAAVGSDQFVYWDPTEPRACLAPDAFLRFGKADDLFRSWKVWERGAPQVAIEIVSESDERDWDWEGQLEKYRRLGVSELVRFDPEASDRPLRVWDSIEHDLVERMLSGPQARSRCVPGFWLPVVQRETGLLLRLSHDEQGLRLYPTFAEQQAEARRAAEQRVSELEEELRRRESQAE